MENVSDMASLLWEDLGSPNSPSLAYINAWLETNLGSLNLKLNKSFIVEDGKFVPELKQTEQEIYKKIFYISYYKKKIRDAISGILEDGADWTQIKEGDSSITRGSRNEIIKSLKNLESEEQNELTSLIWDYKRNQSQPSEINTNTCP